MLEISPLLAKMLFCGTPLLLAALGLLMNERVGVLNLGAEGMMLMGAMAGFAATYWTSNVWLGLLFGALVAALLAALFGVLVIYLMTNQYATGLAVMLFGSGVSATLGVSLVQNRLDIAHLKTAPAWADVPILGEFFSLHPAVYMAILLTVVIAWFLYKTRWGLVMRAVGESPESAHAIGYPVRRIRMLAVIAGGALCGMAGAFISIIDTPLWSANMTGGKGWIALALIAFATWRPARILLGAYLFGGVTALVVHLKANNVSFVNEHILDMMPYLATIFVLIIISRQPGWIRANMPASLGKAFHPNS